MKSDNSISWLHISDLHIFESTDLSIMIAGYEKLAKDIKPNFIVVTGDFRQLNHKENLDYSQTLEFLKKIITIFKVEKKDVFLVPGNHDVKKAEEVEKVSTRSEAIKAIIEEKNNPEKYKDYLKDLKEAFSDYSKFVKKFYGKEVTDNRVSKPDEVICLTWNDKLNIILLNTALISDEDKEHEEIIDIRALSEITINKELPTLVLAHHDFHNICDAQKDRMVILFENFGVKAYLCGDAHKEKVNFIAKYDDISHKIPCIICGKSAVQLMDNYSDVGLIYYTWKDNGFVYVTPYEWTNNSFNISNKFDNGRKFQFPISYKEPFIYPSLLDAHEDIAKDIQQSSFIEFYGLRGKTFLDSEDSVITPKIRNNSDLQKKFLISYPFSEKIRQRLKSLPNCKNSAQCEKNWEAIFKQEELLKNEQGNNVRFHDTLLLFRLIITDNHLYFGYYELGKPTDYSVLYRFDKNTPTYETYKAFFDYQWKKAKRSLPSEIPAKYSFLKKRFSVQPSLVINVTSDCDLHCIYCPEGGENLRKIEQKDYLSEDVLKKLISVFREQVKESGEPVLRITGGEPLYNKESHSKTAAILNAARDYKKIVLCTNGIFLKEAYMAKSKEWDAVRSKLLLKISLDTLKVEHFCEISRTGRNGVKLFEAIIENIKFANSKGFKIELNVVATKFNLYKADDIIKIFDFARELGLVGVKILTVNDFGGDVKIEQSEKEKKDISRILNDVIREMQEREYEEVEIYLNDNKGIQMRRFIAVSDNDKKCTLTIVDHNNSPNSITPRRTFSDFCTSCKYFLTSEQVRTGEVKPCATGMMSLTVRADGMLSPCRLCAEDKWKDIKNVKQIERIMRESLKAFDNCYHKQIEPY